MRLAFLSLIAVAAHVSVVVDCRPGQHQAEGINAGPAAGSGRVCAEPSRSVRKGTRRGLLVKSNFVFGFDWRWKLVLCVDFKGKLHKSRQKDTLGHLFFMWPDAAKHRDELVDHQKPPEVSSAQLETFLVKRRRRSEEVNPSDPLRSESNPPHSAKETDRAQPEQELTGSVSKETITSVDDPLWVLRSNGHGSPVKTNIADWAEHE